MTGGTSSASGGMTRAMKRAAAALAIALLLALPGAANAAVSCGATITQDTVLDADLDCDGNGIVIGADGITLDLAGHSVSADGSSILNQGHDDVTIENGSVVVDTVGIRLQGVTGNLIRNVSLSGLQNGIEMYDSDANRIVANRLSGVWLRLQNGSDDNVIRANTVLAYEGLIWLVGSSGNRVTANVISNSQETGVVLAQATHTLVSRNDVTAINGGGVSLFESHDNEVASNVVHARPNGANPIDVFGIRVTGSHANLLRRNRFFDTTTAIDVASGWGNELRRNEALNGLQDGFLVEAAAVGTTLLRNYAQNFGDDGIDARSVSTRLGHNTANGNGALGIRAVPGVTDLGGNSATGNGDPAQCLNVAC